MRGTGESGQGTRITFRQEKGSEEGFMAVFEQFRTTWGWVFFSLFSPSSCARHIVNSGWMKQEKTKADIQTWLTQVSGAVRFTRFPPFSPIIASSEDGWWDRNEYGRERVIWWRCPRDGNGDIFLDRLCECDGVGGKERRWEQLEVVLARLWGGVLERGMVVCVWIEEVRWLYWGIDCFWDNIWGWESGIGGGAILNVGIGPVKGVERVEAEDVGASVVEESSPETSEDVTSDARTAPNPPFNTLTLSGAVILSMIPLYTIAASSSSKAPMITTSWSGRSVNSSHTALPAEVVI
jgi:hypothetical protein